MREVRIISRKPEKVRWGSSETVRQTASSENREEQRMRQSELHGDMESTAETIVPRETNLQVILQGFTE